MKTVRSQFGSRGPHTLRRGQSLVEFAVVALVFYFMLAAILTFGHMMFVAQGVQSAVDVAAREISRTPLPAQGLTLTDFLDVDSELGTEHETVVKAARDRIYDERYLVLKLDDLPDGSSLAEMVADLPVVNRQLVPLMISDTIEGVRVLRYPGAVFGGIPDMSATPPTSGYRVLIPEIVTSRAGTETINLRPVVEAVGDGFPLVGSGEEQGMVSLRINYPFQSASMSNFRQSPDGPFEPNIGNAVEAGAVQLDSASRMPSGTEVESDREFGAFTGRYSLGQQAALGKTLRPFRRIIQVQANYRREIYSD